MFNSLPEVITGDSKHLGTTKIRKKNNENVPIVIYFFYVFSLNMVKSFPSNDFTRFGEKLN